MNFRGKKEGTKRTSRSTKPDNNIFEMDYEHRQPEKRKRGKIVT